MKPVPAGDGRGQWPRRVDDVFRFVARTWPEPCGGDRIGWRNRWEYTASIYLHIAIDGANPQEQLPALRLASFALKQAHAINDDIYINPPHCASHGRTCAGINAEKEAAQQN